MSVIKTRKLSKTFGDLRAISDIDISIREGSITGFLGPNGAGKSTTMNVLLGFISASGGEAFLFDEKVGVGNVRARRDVGFLANNMALDGSLSVAQELEFFGRLNKNYDADFVRDLAAKLGLDMKLKIGNLSTGNRQKVALIVALLAKPKLLILDEPTNGLDPLVQAEFNKIIRQFRDDGATIFISSHILSEVQELCDDFIFIKRGRIVAQMTRDELAAGSNEMITIKPSPQNRAKIIELLRKNKIKFEQKTTDLESTFMKFYEDENA
ncbi:MAG: ABC transporter ATP-binding protein [Candidatus Nomurabacteria bacterium]|jgi:ABC-2 type transport system ATP-binding protein|nr:ABC transporter ATP-binding protein [Candidatus Nomurabacteria bacterium]